MDKNAERAAKVLDAATSVMAQVHQHEYNGPSLMTQLRAVEVGAAVAALADANLLLTDADERLLVAVKAYMAARKWQASEYYSGEWKEVVEAWHALTPPAPKKPRWGCTGWWLTRDNVAILNVEELGTKAERLAVMRALADARDGAGKWEEA